MNKLVLKEKRIMNIESEIIKLIEDERKEIMIKSYKKQITNLNF